jgi:hypothetical protein
MSSVGRMPASTALAFVFLGTALLLLAARSKHTLRAAVVLLGALTALLGMFALLGLKDVVK